MWKKRQPPKEPLQPRISKPTNFPTGTAVGTERGVYFIKGNTRFKFGSERAFKSWSLVAVPAEYVAIKHTKFGGALGFRDTTLLQNIADGKLYLVAGNLKRQIVSPDVFEKYGIDKNAAVEVSQEEIQLHKDGEVLK